MKKILSVILALGIFATMSGFTQKPITTSTAVSVSTTTPITVRGTVTSINAGKDGTNIFVDGVKQDDTLYDKASVHINIHTIIIKDNLKRLFFSSDIKVGDTVEATLNEPLAMIYPVSGNAKQIKIVSKPKTIIPYTTTQAYLAMTAGMKKTVIDWKKATSEDFTAPEKFTIAQNGKLVDIGGKQTIAVTFQVDNSKIMLGPITVYIDKVTKKVLGFGLRK